MSPAFPPFHIFLQDVHLRRRCPVWQELSPHDLITAEERDLLPEGRAVGWKRALQVAAVQERLLVPFPSPLLEVVGEDDEALHRRLTRKVRLDLNLAASLICVCSF